MVFSLTKSNLLHDLRVGQRHTIRYLLPLVPNILLVRALDHEPRTRLYLACFAPVGTGRVFIRSHK